MNKVVPSGTLRFLTANNTSLSILTFQKPVILNLDTIKRFIQQCNYHIDLGFCVLARQIKESIQQQSIITKIEPWLFIRGQTSRILRGEVDTIVSSTKNS